MEMVTAIKIAGFAVILGGLVLCVIVNRSDYYSPIYKRVAPFAFLLIPIFVIILGNYHVFEGSQKVSSCLRCHVMTPMAMDMVNPESTTLAARHYKNKWIAKRQCFTCHKDYGLNGTVKAKLDGFRHLVKYSLGNYELPIRFRGRFNNQNCLECHRGTQKFEGIKSHHTLRKHLESNQTNCTHCHGFPHPSPAERHEDRLPTMASRQDES